MHVRRVRRRWSSPLEKCCGGQAKPPVAGGENSISAYRSAASFACAGGGAQTFSTHSVLCKIPGEDELFRCLFFLNVSLAAALVQSAWMGGPCLPSSVECLSS
jgi:hypothetical protein